MSAEPVPNRPPAPEKPDYEIVLVAYRSAELVRGLLDALPGRAIAVVDNAHGVDGLEAVTAGRAGVRYLDGPGRGFASGANVGARTSTRDVVVFVNPDSSPSVEQLDALVADITADPGLGAVSATTVLPDGRVEIGVGGWEPTVRRALVHAVGAHKLFPTAGLWATPVPGQPISLDWLSGACMAVRRAAFVDLGGFDEQFFVYNEDVAFGRTLREAGLRQRVRTDLLVRHLGGGSGDPKTRMVQLRGASMVRYVRRHNTAATVFGIRIALTAGYAPRWAAAALRGRAALAAEHAAYVTGLWRGAPAGTST
ncbi:MAG: glycosyltransferase family 2 protein [Pseudonocardia sp.]|nr:glycosyltransferase family 2 protein [Pseudonocardia sp.]